MLYLSVICFPLSLMAALQIQSLFNHFMLNPSHPIWQRAYAYTRPTKLNHLLAQLSYNPEQIHSGGWYGPDGASSRMSWHRTEHHTVHTLAFSDR